MIPSLCQLSLNPATAGFLPEGKPQKGAPGCERDVVKRARDGSEIIHEVVDGCDCAICFEPLSKPDPNGAPYILADSCSHQFHWKCIYKWVNYMYDVKCPTCREPIPEADIKAMKVAADDFDESLETALAAVAQDGAALEFVPTDRANYSKIALKAVEQNGAALRFVPPDTDDYRVIALVAVVRDSAALQYVPRDRDDYDELAMVARVFGRVTGD